MALLYARGCGEISGRRGARESGVGAALCHRSTKGGRAQRRPYRAADSHSVRVARAVARSGEPSLVKISTARRAWGRASAAWP